MTKEIWKPIEGFEGLYEVSNLGRIKSIKRNTTKGGILKLYTNKQNGYVYAGLTKNNRRKTFRVHRLVMSTFVGWSELQVNHIDGDKTNNKLSNLEYCTGSENMIHAYKNNLEKVTWNKRVINLTTGKIYESATDAAKSVGGSKANAISRVCSGERSAYRNNKFAYYDDYINGTIPKFKGKFTKRSSKSLWV